MKNGISSLWKNEDWLVVWFGLILISAMIGFFSSGYSPPGIFGEVLRHNQEEKIDSSPLIYSEVENMADRTL